MDIRTAAVTEPGKIEILTLDTPALEGNEVLVKVHAVALCTLEQRIFSGEVRMPLPCTGGHEVAGEIAALGPEAGKGLHKAGDRVVVRLLYACGECRNCRKGRTNMCENARTKPVRPGMLPGPGGLCDSIIVKPDALFPIPDNLPYGQAALSEPLACVVHSVRRAGIELADDVVVLGGGVMGQLHVMLAARRGARVIVSEPDPQRRELALRSGASLAIDPLACDPVQAVLDCTGGHGADVVFNTTPVASVAGQAVAMTAAGGTMIQFSSVHPDAPFPLSPQSVHEREITISGSISPRVEDFDTAVRLLSSSIIDCSALIGGTFPFEQAQKAFEEAVRPCTMRIIISD